MSNLNLGPLGYIALVKRTRSGRTVKLGYETRARHIDFMDEPYVVIEHHGNRIAEIGETEIMVTNSGWDSSTTRDRLNRILDGNNVPFFICQRDYQQCLVHDYNYETSTERENIMTASFLQARFSLVDGDWRLSCLNHSDIRVGV